VLRLYQILFSKHSSGADKVGIASAFICSIHCMLVPLFIMVRGWYGKGTLHGNGHFLHAQGADFWVPSWWESVDYLFLIISFFAVYHAANHAFSKYIKLSLWFFWFCLANAIFFESILHWISYIASAGLIITHLVNLRQQHVIAVSKQV